MVFASPAVKRRRTRTVGRTRVNPTLSATSTTQYMAKKVARFGRRVERLCKTPGAPLMAFICIRPSQVDIKGSPFLCELLAGVKGEDLVRIATPAVVANATVVPETKAVNMKGIDPRIDWNAANAHVCRKALSVICLNKEGERVSYSIENRPDFWPDDVPFCSHSAKSASGGRVLSTTDIRTVLEAFVAYCLQKVNEGYTPVNYPSNLTREQIEGMVRRSFSVPLKETHAAAEKEVLQDVEVVVAEDPEGVPPNEEADHCADTNQMSTDFEVLRMMTEKDTSGLIRYLEINWPVDITGLKKWLGEWRPLEMEYSPSSHVLKSYRGPANLSPGKPQRNVWELFNQYPDITRLHVFHHGMEHIKHYVDQICFDRQNSSAMDIEELLLEVTIDALSSQQMGPGILMLLAGALGCQLDIFKEKKESSSYQPCPCVVGQCETVNVLYIDQQERVYGLSERTLWRGRRTSLDRKTSKSLKARRLGQLPGIDGPLLTCYGIEVWRGEVDRVKKGEWLDDSIVNVLLRHAKEERRATDVFVAESMFALSLLVPIQKLDSRDTLPLTACNSAEADRYLRVAKKNILEYRLVIIPICDNVHWTLAALYPSTGHINMLCSLGKRNSNAAAGLKTYFEERLTRPVAVKYPKVPTQRNSDDCGVRYEPDRAKQPRMEITGKRRESERSSPHTKIYMS